ncbi:Syntaxin-binding protein 5 [Coemansia biformis]|uniref:Syntaxin-binding protein 5 n=1 Tax=Coemansia biformis TaxID=1286918 RepID=A0A9W8CYJ8_9FUNG|nr:Syntaxin-binding protein 5 [Coemansia biformis]
MSGPRAAPELLQVIEDRAVDPAVGATAAAVDPTQHVIAVGYATGAVRLFFAGHPLSTEVRLGGSSPIRHLAFVPGDPALAAIDSQGVLRVLDTDTLEVCFAFDIPLPPTCIGLIPGTSWLLVGTNAGRVYFVDAVEGRKSDFSIGCLATPTSPVAAVEAHPVEAEKILVAYASGECVVCDLGRASDSEKAMVLSRHRFEHPPALTQQHPQDAGTDAGPAAPRLSGAGWSPTGERFAAAYSSGVVCVFNAAAGAAPVAARVVQCPDLRTLEGGDGAAVGDADRGMRALRGIRWCTHAQLDRSFLVVDSEATTGTQAQIHILEAKCRDTNVKSSRDIASGGSYALPSPLLAVTSVPGMSPWRNGNDGVRYLAVIAGRRPRVQLLDILPSMHLRPSKELPDELEWCLAAPRSLHRAAGELNSALGRFLAGTFRRGQPVPAEGIATDPRAPSAAPQKIARLYCCIDGSDKLSFWCAADGRLQRCHGLDLDLRRLARLVGVDGEATSVSLCAQIGLLAVGMASGEVLLAMLTSDPWASHAQRYTPLAELQGQAAVYYRQQSSTGPRAPKHSREARGGQPPGLRLDTGLQSLQAAPTLGSEPANPAAPRTTSLHEAGLLRRGSKRISASFGTLFRRASLTSEFTDKRQRDRRATAVADHGSRLRGFAAHQRKAAASADVGADLARPAQINAGDWSEQLGRMNGDMSQMLFGLRFDIDEQQRIFGAGQPTEAPAEGTGTPMPGAGASPRVESTPRPYAMPFMLARFVNRRVSCVATARDGLAAVAYECGAIVVIDGFRQRTLLADNINMVPAATSSVRSLFDDSHTDATAPAASVTAAIFSARPDQAQQTTYAQDTTVGTLLVGTSQGHVVQYAVYDVASPPRVVARPSAAPVTYLWSDDDGNLGLELAAAAAAVTTGVSQRPFIAATASAISLYAGPDTAPTATFSVPDPHAQLVAVRMVRLGSGWRGVAAVDSRASVALFSLPDLRCVARQPLPGDAGALLSSANVHLGEDGGIDILGPAGRLLQLRIAPGSSDPDAAADCLKNAQRPRFDPSLQPPARPARKGLTSWLLGKATDPSRDIDRLLGSHHRDLLRGGGTRPGARLRKDAAPPEADDMASPKGSRRRRDSKVEDITATLAATPLAEAQEMLDMRGQQLEDITDATQQMRGQTQGFLDRIRAHNAKQERRSKRRLGLF